MKILVLSNLYPPDTLGGYEMGCSHVVEALRDRGHDVLVLTTAPRTPAPPLPYVRRGLRLTDIWDEYSFQRSAPVTSHLVQARSHRVDAFNVHALATTLEEFEPDVAYVWMIVGVGGLGLLGCLHHLRVPWVWHLMDDVPLMLCKAGGRLVPAFAREFERQLRGHYLACSRQLVDEIEGGGLRLRGEVEIVPNWVRGPAPPSRTSYRRDGVLRIVAASANIDRRFDKGIDLVIESAALLREWGRSGFAVNIFGRVADPYFPALIRRYKLDDVVTLKGSLPQSELQARYGDYDLFAFPTHAREPFAFAPLEAAYRGCVPLMSELCGNGEWFVHGVHCLKAPRTAEAFARVVARVLDGQIDLPAIGRRAAGVVRRDFHLDAVLPTIERALACASATTRAGAGTAAEAYRMAVLAEKLSHVLIQEALCA
ncbi:MAG TPA: glycosyltransferase family 4 protein [Isosphaeraceae bacterium]|nr:glycosyltransferase family 4 protein [Isosphaeraceae bacterium]